MQTDISRKIKAVDLKALVESEGFDPQRSGSGWVILCPSPHHVENTPSCHIYPNNRFHCFGCGESGDPVDCVRLIHGFDFKAACRHLGLESGELSADERRAIEARKQQRAKRKLQRQRESDLSFTLGTMIRCVGASTISLVDIEVLCAKHKKNREVKRQSVYIHSLGLPMPGGENIPPGYTLRRFRLPWPRISAAMPAGAVFYCPGWLPTERPEMTR